ncbi:MAG: dihydroorotate dehydrogenase-like protein [Bacteroidales bacterium]|nr:dihydroorotate dehydrogenase-like protein [Bacteroidales bacterium]
MNIQTQYMGMTINSPIIAGSCGKTNSIENIIKLKEAGAGAIILKSLFEEQITNEISRNTRVMQNAGEMMDAYAYIVEHTRNNQVEQYLNLIREAKKAVDIPIIASVNCISTTEWLQFAKEIERAGADGIELNMFILPSNVNVSSEDVEQIYEDIILTIRRIVSLPISLKISPYSAALAKFCQRLSWLGISSLSLFNRFMEHDINIEDESIHPANVLSSPSEVYNTIKWTSILSKLINCPITAGGGVHKEEDIIKLLLVGANTVQVASALYTEDFSFITKANERLKQWMQERNYHNLNDFRGRLAIEKNNTVSPFYRVQFMKHFAEIE